MAFVNYVHVFPEASTCNRCQHKARPCASSVAMHRCKKDGCTYATPNPYYLKVHMRSTPAKSLTSVLNLVVSAHFRPVAVALYTCELIAKRSPSSAQSVRQLLLKVVSFQHTNAFIQGKSHTNAQSKAVQQLFHYSIIWMANGACTLGKSHTNVHCVANSLDTKANW